MAAPTATMADNQASGGKQGSVAGSAFIMVAAVVMSRLLGMVRDMVVAAQFGRNAHTDAYIAAFKVPDLLMYLVAGGAISSTFIPTFTEYLHKKDEKGAWETFSVVGTMMSLVTAAFIVLMEIFAPALVRLLNPGYSAAKIAEAIPLTRIVLPAQFCFIVGSLLIGSLNARNRMFIPALGPSIYNFGIIIGALFSHPPDMRGLMWGALGGAFIGNFLIQAISSARLGMRFKPSLNFRHPGAQKVWKMLMPIMFGMALPNVDQIVMSFFASMLPNGDQTALTFANRTMLIPIGIFAQAMSIAVLPAMARHMAAGAVASFRVTTSKTLRTILFLTVPSSALMFALALPIIQMLYQRHNFHAADAVITAAALRFYCLGIFAWACLAILTRGFYALHDSNTPVWTGRLMTVVLILLNLIVVHLAAGPAPLFIDLQAAFQATISNIALAFSTHSLTPFAAIGSAWGHMLHTLFDARFTRSSHPFLAVEGIALSTTLAATSYTIILFVMLRHRVKDLDDRQLTITAVRILLATLALCLVTSISQAAYHAVFVTGSSHVTLYSFVEIAACGGLGLLAYVGVARYYHMQELAELENLMISKLQPILTKFKRA